MKKNKTITLLAIAATLLCSCITTKTYYEMVEFKTRGGDSSNASVIENTDIRLSYNLWNNGGNMQMRLYNKSDSDLLINWQHSTLVVNNMVVNYNSNDRVTVQSSATANYYRNRNNYSNYNPASTQSLSTSQTLQYQVQPGVSLLPPGTYIDRNPYTIGSSFHDPVYSTDAKTGFRIYRYETDSSPLNIDNIISYSYLSDLNRQKTIKSSLSVSQVTVMDEAHKDKLNTGNKQLAYFNRKDHTEESAGGAIATVVLISIGMAIAAVASE